MPIHKQLQKCASEMKICFRCYQTIYQIEQLGPILGQFYHKACFRCIFCDRNLDLKSFSTNTHDLSDKHVYCKSHTPRTKNQYMFCEVKKVINSNSSNLESIENVNTDLKAHGSTLSIESISAKIKIGLCLKEESKQLSIVIHEAV
jgi:hypothetical protein